MSEIREALEEYARNHRSGAIGRAAALAAGMPVSQIDRRVRRRQWMPSGFRGWMILAELWHDPRAHLTCATESLNGVAWRRSALALNGVGSHPSRPEILTRSQHKTGKTRFGRYDPTIWRAVKLHGITSLTLQDAVASMAGVYNRSRFDELVDGVILEKRTDWHSLAIAFKRIRRQGRLGSALLGQVLDERDGERVVPLSTWSRKVARALDDAGFAKPVFEWRIESGGRLIAQVDLAYPAHRYAIELDSVAYHLNRRAFEEDRRRDADLAAAGWLVRRFTWSQFANQLPWMLRIIRSDLRSRPPSTRSARTPIRTL